MAVLKKLSGAATSLIAFAPWILYGFGSGFNHWRIAAGGGLILWLASAATARSRGASIKLMDLTALAFFAIASVPRDRSARVVVPDLQRGHRMGVLRDRRVELGRR